MLLSVVVFVGIAIVCLPYALCSYILLDNKDLKAGEIVKKSAELMQNKKFEFFKLILSFIGWFLLIAIISALIGNFTFEAMANYASWFGMIFLMPYFVTSILVFYEETLNSHT